MLHHHICGCQLMALVVLMCLLDGCLFTLTYESKHSLCVQLQYRVSCLEQEGNELPSCAPPVLSAGLHSPAVFSCTYYSYLMWAASVCYCRSGRQPDPDRTSYDAFLYAFLIDVSLNASPLAFLNATCAPVRFGTASCVTWSSATVPEHKPDFVCWC